MNQKISRHRLKLRRRAPWLIVLLAVMGLATQHVSWLRPAQQVAQQTQPGLYHVVEVYDGDTISVDMNGHVEKVRFIGVDTPETHDPRKVVQCFGAAASNFTEQFLDGKNVKLEADQLSTNRDRYDRLLRYVYLPDGTLVNGEIIKQGYGFAYVSFPFSKLEEFRGYEKSAREGNRGLWADCQPTPNQYGGYTSNPANP